jgi:PAS domain S-box-containing protein
LDFSGKLKQEVAKRKQSQDELKKEKNGLREMRAKYKALFKAIPAGVAIVDLETGKILDCNPWLEKLVGKNKSALKKQCIWELGPSDQWDAARSSFFQGEHIGEERSRQVTIRMEDGQYQSFRHTCSLIKANGKGMLQFIFTSMNL